MSQVQTQMEDIEQFLEEMGANFLVEGNKIKIEGKVVYADDMEITIDAGNTKVAFDNFLETNRLLVENERRVKDLLLPKNVNAYYSYPYLIINVWRR